MLLTQRSIIVFSTGFKPLLDGERMFLDPLTELNGLPFFLQLGSQFLDPWGIRIPPVQPLPLFREALDLRFRCLAYGIELAPVLDFMLKDELHLFNSLVQLTDIFSYCVTGVAGFTGQHSNLKEI